MEGELGAWMSMLDNRYDEVLETLPVEHSRDRGFRCAVAV